MIYLVEEMPMIESQLNIVEILTINILFIMSQGKIILLINLLIEIMQ